MRLETVAVLSVCAVAPLCAQPRVDLRNTYERVVCLVPMIGAGTHSDPRRPMFAPAPGEQDPASPESILAFTYDVTDDGQFAIAEFVARDRAAFRRILDNAQVKAFRKGHARRGDIEKEFRKYKKDFDLEKFGVGVQ